MFSGPGLASPQQILPTRPTTLQKQTGLIDITKQVDEPLLDSSDGDKRTFGRFGQYSSADEPAGRHNAVCFSLGSDWKDI